MILRIQRLEDPDEAARYMSRLIWSYDICKFNHLKRFKVNKQSREKLRESLLICEAGWSWSMPFAYTNIMHLGQIPGTGEQRRLRKLYFSVTSLGPPFEKVR